MPPLGAMASPNMVTSSDPPLMGRWLWNRRSNPCVAVATVDFTAKDFMGLYCDTEMIARSQFLCHIARLNSRS